MLLYPFRPATVGYRYDGPKEVTPHPREWLDAKPKPVSVHVAGMRQIWRRPGRIAGSRKQGAGNGIGRVTIGMRDVGAGSISRPILSCVCAMLSGTIHRQDCETWALRTYRQSRS
jgi:hypothetical protein